MKACRRRTAATTTAESSRLVEPGSNTSQRSSTSRHHQSPSGPALLEVTLSDNDIGDAGFDDIGPALQKCQYLEGLSLAGTSLTGSSMELLTSLLAKLPCLKMLMLQKIQLNANGFEKLAPVLQQCCGLDSLYLDDCGLTDHGQVVPWLTLVLLSLPKLKRLSRIRSAVQGETFVLTTVYFLVLNIVLSKSIRVLWLENIGMTSSESMSTIIHLLKRLNRLQDLNISNNPYTGSSTDMQLCTAVKGHPSLEILWVPNRLSRDAGRRLKSFQHDSTCLLKSLLQLCLPFAGID